MTAIVSDMRYVLPMTILTLLSAAMPAGAQQISQESLRSLLTISGKCSRFVVGGRDFTSSCLPKVASNNIPPNRVQMHFTFKAGVIITISGTDRPNITPDKDSITVDRVTINLGIDGVPPAAGKASGRCTFGNPYKGPMTIRCTGRQDGKPIDVSFRTDGRPPR